MVVFSAQIVIIRGNKLSESDKWFRAEMPNSHKKVNKERIETVIYSCVEASWDYQQAKINDSENTRAVLYRENIDIRAKIDELQARVDEAMKYIEPSDELRHKAYRDLVKILKGNKDESIREL